MVDDRPPYQGVMFLIVLKLSMMKLYILKKAIKLTDQFRVGAYVTHFGVADMFTLRRVDDSSRILYWTYNLLTTFACLVELMEAMCGHFGISHFNFYKVKMRRRKCKIISFRVCDLFAVKKENTKWSPPASIIFGLQLQVY